MKRFTLMINVTILCFGGVLYCPPKRVRNESASARSTPPVYIAPSDAIQQWFANSMQPHARYSQVASQSICLTPCGSVVQGVWAVPLQQRLTVSRTVVKQAVVSIDCVDGSVLTPVHVHVVTLIPYMYRHSFSELREFQQYYDRLKNQIEILQGLKREKQRFLDEQFVLLDANPNSQDTQHYLNEVAKAKDRLHVCIVGLKFLEDEQAAILHEINK